MNIVSVINYKGGVGKTTITANLGAELARRGFRVLLIDLDPQASLTFSFISPEDWTNRFFRSGTIKEWFDSLSKGSPINLDSLIFTPRRANDRLSERGRLDLIPSHLGLINVDLELATELSGANLKQAKRNYLKVHKRLANGLQELDPDLYFIVLIDCPPNFNIVTKNAIVASNFILIPAKPDYLSTLGIDYLIRNMNDLIRDFNDFAQLDNENDNEEVINPGILGVVFTMVTEYGGRPISAMRPYIRQTRDLGIPVFESYIKENKTIFADAPEYGVPVVIAEFYSGSHQSVVVGLQEFATEFSGRLTS